MSDVVVIGGGHNGLVAATRLAKAGRSVILLERREKLGGLCSEIEFHPGYRLPGVLQETAAFRPAIADALNLGEQGLRWEEEKRARLGLAAEGPGLSLPPNPYRAEELSREDRQALADWRTFLDRVRPVVQATLAEPPPTLAPASFPDFWQLGRRGWSLRALGKEVLLELLRVTPMAVADWLEERFSHPLLVEMLAAPSLLGGWLGPWAAGTAANLLLLESASGRSIHGGPRALVSALELAARGAGVEIRTSGEVREIRIREGRVAGVALEDGEEIPATAVLASCDPRQAFLRLVDPGWLPQRFAVEMANFRSRGTTALICLALSAPLEIAGREGELFETMSFGGGHPDDLEKAFDAVKYRRCSERPHLLATIPSVTDPSLAPAGHHVVSILAQCAPFDLDGGWSAAALEAFGEAVIDRISRQVPDLRDRLVALRVFSPADLAAEYALPEGHLHHGESSLDQLFVLRPAAAASRYATPVEGLFLGGSGSHPGGGITGGPGWLGAGALLAAGD